MKVISLWRPWGLAVIYGYKTIETRCHQNFRGLVGQRIGIHNTAKWDVNAQWIMTRYLQHIDVDCIWFFRQKHHPPKAIIGTVYVEEFRELTDDWGNQKAALCPITTNKYGLILSEPRAFDQPIFVNGAMGIWNYHDDALDVAEKIC